MGQRVDLQYLLCDILGSNNVYFQPQENIRLQYPCIIYSLDDISHRYADNVKYHNANRYMVEYIGLNPELDVQNKILELKYSSFSRRYVSDGLYHDVFEIYF